MSKKEYENYKVDVFTGSTGIKTSIVREGKMRFLYTRGGCLRDNSTPRITKPNAKKIIKALAKEFDIDVVKMMEGGG